MDKQWIDFNANNKVRVRLTEIGRAELRRERHELNAYIVRRGGKPIEGLPYKEDAQGWSEWQLWELMKGVGHLCGLGMPNPFDMSIQFISEAL